MAKTIAFSDLHLGYSGFNKTQFESFLNYLKEADPSRLLILGDLFDLWRADPINSLSYGWQYIEALRNLGIETHYVIGNHDYHNWISCLELGKKDNFLWMKIHPYPFDIIDGSLVVHGDYFDIYKVRNVVPGQAIYGVYEAIYHGDKSTVQALERYFYNPVMLLIKWIELYKKNPEVAKKQQIASELRTFMNLDSPEEMRKLEKSVRYLKANPAIGTKLLIPASSRPQLSADLRRQTPTPRSKQDKSSKKLGVPKSNAPVRNLLATKSPFELAKEISNNSGISRVIFGHTHMAVNKASESWWNTGCWVDNESIFIEIENGNVHLYRFNDGSLNEIPEV